MQYTIQSSHQNTIYQSRSNEQNCNSIKNKRQQFRYNIRKNAIESLFKVQRMKIVQQNQFEQKKQFLQGAQTCLQREIIIKTLRANFGGQPNWYWKKSMQKLSWLAQNPIQTTKTNEWSQYFQYQIINNLYLTFEWEYKQIKLSSLSAKIFYLLAPSNFNQKKSYYDKLLDNQTFFDNLIQLLNSQKIQRNEALNYILLLADIADSDIQYRNRVLKCGAPLIVLGIYKANQKNGRQDVYFSEVIILFIHSLLKKFEQQGQKKQIKLSSSNKNLIKEFTPIIDHQLSHIKSQKSRQFLFEILISIIGLGKQKFNIRQILESQIPKNIMKHISFQNLNSNQKETQKIRKTSIILCSVLSCAENFSMSSYFIKQGILDQILKLYKKYIEIYQNKNSENVSYFYQQGQIERKQNQICMLLFNVMRLLANLLDSSQEDIQKIISHPVFEELLIKYSNPLTNSKILKESIYSLSTIVCIGSKQSYQILLKSYNLLGIFMQNLEKNSSINQITFQILSSISKMIQEQQLRRQPKQQNIILDILFKYYDFQKIICELSQKHNNRSVKAKADQIIQLIGNNSMKIDGQKNNEIMSYEL